MFRELSIARFKLDKPVFLEKVFVLYKRSNLASFLFFIGNRTVTKFSCVLLVNKVQFVFRELRLLPHQASPPAAIRTGNQLRAWMPAAISAFFCAAWPGDIFKMRPLPNRETIAVLHFGRMIWRGRFKVFGLRKLVGCFWCKRKFPKFLARKEKALATILLSVEQPLILFLLAGR